MSDERRKERGDMAQNLEDAFNELQQHVNLLGQQFNEANEGHVANYVAIILALINKGVLTYEDYYAAKAQATHSAEQEFARKRDAIQSEDDVE
jgi:hypothetical protein